MKALTKDRADFIYVAASKRRTVFVTFEQGRATRTRSLFEASLFWWGGEAYSWCEGRKGWSPMRVAEKTSKRA